METLLKNCLLPLTQLFPSLMLSIAHLMRQKKDFSCMHSVGEDSVEEWENTGLSPSTRDKIVKIRKASIMFGDNV